MGIGKKQIWELDIQSIRECKLLCKNPFWKDVLTIWSEFKESNMGDVDGRCYPLWGSFFMKNDNLKARKDDLIQQGISYVNDLLSDNGEKLGYQEFATKYRVNLNFVDFYSLVHSIPRIWLNGKNSKLDRKKGYSTTDTKFMFSKICDKMGI